MTLEAAHLLAVDLLRSGCRPGWGRRHLSSYPALHPGFRQARERFTWTTSPGDVVSGE